MKEAKLDGNMLLVTGYGNKFSVNLILRSKIMHEVEKALEFCHKNKEEYIRGFETVEEGLQQFDCVISLLEDGTITPGQLKEYGLCDEDLAKSTSGIKWEDPECDINAAVIQLQEAFEALIDRGLS